MTDERPAAFLTPLDVRELDDGRKMLLAPLKFYSAELRGIVVAPEGTITNYASVPRAFWGLFSPGGPWKWASVLHDCGYGENGAALVTQNGALIHLTKKLGDRLFREAMTLREDIPDQQREVMFRIVRRFGGRIYGGLHTTLPEPVS